MQHHSLHRFGIGLLIRTKQRLDSSRIVTTYMMYIHPRFEDFGDSRVMAVECWPAKSPVYVKDDKVERFYIGAGASTAELPASQALEYTKLRFKG